MISNINSWVKKHVKRRSSLWHVFNFFYNLFLGTYFLNLSAKYKRFQETKNLPLYAVDVLEIVLKVCDDLKMNPFLLRGTLLGHCRDGGLVKGDYDMDLGLLEKDFFKIHLLKQELEKKGFILHSEFQYQEPLKKIGEHFLIQFVTPKSYVRVDFDFFYKINDTVSYIEDRRLEYLYEGKEFADRKAFGPDVVGYALVYPPLIFEEFKKVKFLKSEVLIPANSEKYLELTYGDWRISKKKSKSVYQNMKAVSFNTESQSFDFLDLN